VDQSLISKNLKTISRSLSKNSPTILTALGVAGLVSTVALAIRATPKALEILEREKEFRYEEYGDELPIEIVDTIQLTWRVYLPTIGMGAATIFCIIGANNIQLRRNAALASLFSITEATLKEYQAKVVDTIGEAKEEKIRGEIAQEMINKDPSENKTIILTGKGDYLCYDAFSGRYFRSDIETLRRNENQFNQKLLREGWLNINEFYYEIGLDSIELGDEMGWIAERSLMDLKFTTKIGTNGEPCLIIGYSVSPHHI